MRMFLRLVAFLLPLHFASAQVQVPVSLLEVLSNVGYTNCKLGRTEYMIKYDVTEGSVEVTCRENSMILNFSGEDGSTVYRTWINGSPYQFKAGTEKSF